MSFWETNQHHFVNAGVSILVLVAAWLLYWLLRYAINRFSRRHDLAETDPGAETRLRMIQRLLTVALFFVAIGLVFWIMDVSALKRVAVGMFASAGVVGIALGFAAQTTMANLVSGVIIAFAQPIRLGDNVKIDGEYGAVESIGLFYTYIRTWDNRRLVIPNKLLSDQTIRNYTLVDPRMPALVVLRLDYSADVDAVRALLLEEAQAHPLFLADPEPSGAGGRRRRAGRVRASDGLGAHPGRRLDAGGRRAGERGPEAGGLRRAGGRALEPGRDRASSNRVGGHFRGAIALEPILREDLSLQAHHHGFHRDLPRGL